jgi:dolichol-phosphate mannosyltransferase
VEGWSTLRLVLSRAGNLYARMLLGFPVRDSTSGFRCYRRGVLEGIDLDAVASEGYAFQIDLTYRAWRLGFSIQEVPILFRERERGQSKMSRRIVVEAMRSVTAWGLRDLPRRGRRAETRTAARP